MTVQPGLLNIQQAAAQLGISRPYLYRLCSDKQISYVRLGTSIRFSQDDLQAWIDSKRVPAVKR